MLVSFKDDEDEIINLVLSVLNSRQSICCDKQLTLFQQIQHRDIVILLDKREVIRQGKRIDLTFTEFEILQLLAHNPGRTFSKQQIYEIVWKEPYFGDYNIVTSHISHIREKIEDNPSNPIYIQTVWGVGYRFNQKLGSVS